MVTALIVINQSGKPAGTPGASRDDLSLGTLVVLTNNDNTGVSTWLWEMESRPEGSSATLSGATGPTATFVPDVVGSYMVKLTVDGPSVDPDTDTRIAAVKTAYLEMRKPAAREQLEFDAIDGWAPAMQVALDAIDADAAGSLKADGSVPLDELSSAPGPQSNKGFIYAKDYSGDTHLFYRDSSGNEYQLTPGGSTDEFVKVSSNDTTAGYLNGKLVAGTHVSLVEQNDGADESLRIDTTNNTLDQAYDEGGAGAGRSITVDSGAIQITASGSSALSLLSTSLLGGQALLYAELASQANSQLGAYFRLAADGRTQQQNVTSDLVVGNMPSGGYNAIGFMSSLLAAPPLPGDDEMIAYQALIIDPGVPLDGKFIAYDAVSSISELFDYVLRADHGDILLQDGNLDLADGYVVLGEQSSPPPYEANRGSVFVQDIAGVTALFYMDSAGILSRLDGYSPPTLDLAYDGSGAGGGRTINVDSGPVLLNVSGDDTGLYLQATGHLDQNPILKTEIASDTNSQLGVYFRLTADGYTQQQNVTSDMVIGNMPSGGFNAIGFSSTILVGPPFPGDDEVIAYQALTIDPGVPVDGKFIAYDVQSNGFGEFDYALRADFGDVLLETGNLDLADGYVVLGEQSSDPPYESNRGVLFTKDIGGVTGLFYLDDSGSLSRLDGYSVLNFVGLTDTPSTYAGAANYFVRVNGSADALVFEPGGTGTGLVDGYLPMEYRMSDPTPLDGYGLLYTKNVHDGYSEYHTELFYMDDYGQTTQVTRDGYLACETHEDELDPAVTDGTETSIVLSRPPTPAADRRSGYSLDVYRNGVLMRYVSALGSNPNEWTYNTAQKRVQFVASASAGDWYIAVYQ